MNVTNGRVNFLILLMGLTPFLSACEPSRPDVLAAVADDSPHSRVMSINVGEGDSEHCYVEVAYFDSLSQETITRTYGFRRSGPLGWKMFHRGPIRVLSR